MRALRSRTVQSDEDHKNNEHEIENLEQTSIKHNSKNIRKKSSKHTHDENSEPDKVQSADFSGSNEHEGEDVGSSTEKSKKVKRKKLKKRNHDKSNSESDKGRIDNDNVFNELEQEELGNSSEKDISKKVKRKKLKKCKHVKNNSETNKARNDSDSHSSEKNIFNKIKRKELKKRKHDKNNSELDKIRSDGVTGSSEHEREDLGNSIEKNISKKVKRKKLKKSKHENNPDSTRVRSADNSLSNELETDHLEHSIEKNISTKKKQKKLTTFTHSENDPVSDNLLNDPEKEELGHSTEKNSCKKDKRKKVKERTHDDINPEFDKVQEEKDMKKKKSKKSKRSKGDNSTASTIRAYDTDTKLSPSENEKSVQKLRKIRMRSTILNSPDFTNVVTSTVLKPKRPEKQFKNSENVDLEDNFIYDQKTNKIRRSERKKSLSELTKTFDKHSRKRSLTVADNNITTEDKNNDDLENNCSAFQKSNEMRHSQRKKSMLDRSESVNKFSKNKSLSIEDNSITKKDKNIDDYSVFQESNDMRHSQRKKSLSSRRETLKFSKNKMLPVEQNSIITIEDTLEESYLKKNTSNKMNALQQPEITSDEDETNISLKRKNELSKSEVFEQSLNQSKTKHNLSTKNDTVNKTPKIVSSRKSKRLSDKSLNDSYVYPNLEDSKSDRLDIVNESILENIIDLTYSPDNKQNTFNLSNQVANSTISKSNTRSRSNDTFEIQIVNTSGDWQVNNSQIEINNVDKNKLNDTFEIDNKENDTESPNTTIILNEKITFINENVTPPPVDKNALRKKWLKYPRHSSDAQAVLEQISSPRLKKKMIVEKIINTQQDQLQKPSDIPPHLSVQKNSAKKLPVSPRKSLPKLLQKSVIISKSAKKSVTKRTAMPNFALIHQQAFQKMENLKEYSERKKLRAQMLSSNKPRLAQKSVKATESKTEEIKLKSSRQLFSDDKNSVKFNRFGFKMEQVKKPTPIKPISQIPIIKPVVKPSIFARADVVAIANKNTVLKNNKENRRDILKGVRTNRRFELLMQMRNK